MPNSEPKPDSQPDKQALIDKIDALKSAPCSYDLRNKCLFVKGAQKAVQSANHLEISLNQLKLSKKTINKKVEDLNPNQVSQYVDKRNLLGRCHSLY